MKVWKAADAKRRFSELIHSASEAPQLVELRGKPVGVVVSYERFTKDSHLSAEKTVAEWLKQLAELHEHEGDPELAERSGRREQFDGDWK
ncbi:MAG: type II toxin-antitoxin system prevent-host-death family antitoxin [Spirochaeta sp.]|nr:type II toxin-antitoxin system prevent-host-death family antitoxin [Spirochaeta sp.]